MEGEEEDVSEPDHIIGDGTPESCTCDNQDHPRLTLQNITFADGNSTIEQEYDGGLFEIRVSD